MLSPTPDQAGVEPRVGGDAGGWEAAYEVCRGVPLEIPGKAYAGTQLHLVVGSATFISGGVREVLAACEWMQVHGEECVAGTQGPEGRHLPVGEQFHAMRL